MFHKRPNPTILADLLKTTPKALTASDQAYRNMAINAGSDITGNAMDDMHRRSPSPLPCDKQIDEQSSHTRDHTLVTLVVS